MRHVKRGLAVLLAALLVIPGSPVAMEGVLRSEAAEADAVLEEESAELEDSDTASSEEVSSEVIGSEADGENGGEEESGETDDVDEGGQSGEMAVEPSNAEESADFPEEGNDAMDEESSDVAEGDVESSESISAEGDAEDSDLEENQMEAGLAGEEFEVEQASEDFPVAYAENIVASGADGNITWTLDSNGLLTVSGTGNYSSAPDDNPNLWGAYRDSIVSAKVEVTEMTDAAYMFRDCSNLTSLDLSGFDTSNVTDMYEMFANCSSLTSLDLSSFDTSNVRGMEKMFAGCSGMINLDLSGFDTSNVVDMVCMFDGCSNLTSLDLSGFDTSNVTSMNLMFYGCSSLMSLDLNGFDTSNVTSMNGMFVDCSSLTSLVLSSFDTSNVADMVCMFYGCSNLTSLDLSSFDTRNVTDMGGMFSNCSSLTSLDLSGFDTRNVTDMGGMFASSGMTSLDLSSFNTSNVTDMSGMFSDCHSLTSLNLSGLDTSNVTNMVSMFGGCSSLTSLDLSGFDTSNVTSMFLMFVYCTSLTTLNISSFNTEKVTDMSSMFEKCSSLESLDLSNIDTSNVISMELMFEGCTSLATLNISSFNTENVTSMSGAFENCSSLQTLHAPKIMGITTADLPGIYGASNGKQTRELTGDYVGMTLSKVEEEIHRDAYKIVIEPYETPEIGKEASFKVTVTNSTDRTLFTRWINHWYYREKGNSETYPGVVFGSLLSEAGEDVETDNITFAPGESRTFKLIGVMPDTWSDKSELLLVVYGYDVDEMSYGAYGQDGYPHTETGDHVVSSDYQEIQTAVKDERVKTIDYVLPDGQEIPQEAQKEIFTSIQGSEKAFSFVFQDSQGEEVYRWTFEGNKITNPGIAIKFQIIVDARVPEVLAAIPEDVQKVDLAFINEGILPGVANIKVRVESYFQAERLYLYYYNPDKGRLELVDDNVAFEGIYASFFLDHNSNYVLTAQMLRDLLPQRPGNINKPTNPDSVNKPTTPAAPAQSNNNVENNTYVDGDAVEGQKSAALLRHIVVKGDTLSRIARLYHTTIARLMSLNPAIKNRNIIYIGQIILVDGRVDILNEDTGTGVYHIVRSGDSFYKIAKMYGVPINELMLMNPKLAAQRYIFPGQRVLVNIKKTGE